MSHQISRRAQRIQGLDTEDQAWRLTCDFGYSSRQIAEILGKDHSTIVRALQRSEKRVLARLVESRNAHIAKSLDRLNALFYECQQAWETSKQGTTKKRSIQTDDTAGGGGKRTAMIDQAESAGDPRHIKNALTALDGIRRLLGLDAPKAITLANVDRPYLDTPEDQLRAEVLSLIRAAGLDPSSAVH